MFQLFFKTQKNVLALTIVTFCMLCGTQSYAQELSGKELLKKTIAYHDPTNQWESFKGKLFIDVVAPDGSSRASTVTINLPQSYFELSASKDNTTVNQIVSNNVTSFSLNGVKTLTDEELKKYNLTDSRTKFMKNYYTFLYGLPMKLNDSGTIINPVVERKEFMGKEYLVLKVKYEEGIGKDAWYFYFDPKTYAMEIYQFYHDEAKNDGEYILLTEEETFSGIKFPKNRAWYLNTDQRFLSTDKLTKISNIQ